MCWKYELAMAYRWIGKTIERLKKADEKLSKPKKSRYAIERNEYVRSIIKLVVESLKSHQRDLEDLIWKCGVHIDKEAKRTKMLMGEN